MAANAVTYQSLLAQIGKGDLRPVYLLHGDEGYFIDELVKAFEHVLSDEEKEFNQYILFAPQTAPQEVVDICRRYPMMADRQIVILKECQSARADQLDKLAKYILEPSPQTVLVICARGEKAKGRAMLDAVKKSGAVVFESKKIADYNLPQYIQQFINSRGLNVQPKALEMLKEYIGTDLSRMYNELDKLINILGAGATVTPESVERNIGYSKDYNAFELVDALAAKDAARAMRIVGYFRANPKAVPMVMLTPTLFNFYQDLLIVFSERDKSDRNLQLALGLKSPYGLRKFTIARQHYNAWQAIEAIRAIRRFDAQTKGVGSRRDEYDLLDELIFRLLTAPGHLFPNF